MSTVKVDTIKTTGNVEVYTCKAWVNFDGTQTAANMIRESGNVSSIVDNGTGDYTVNFTTAMPDVNYSFISSSGRGAVGNATSSTNSTAAPTTTSCRTRTYTSTGSAYIDPEYVSVAIFR